MPAFSRFKLSSTKQEDNKTFAEYVERLKRIAKSGHQNANMEQAVIDSIAKNARSLELSKYILGTANPTLVDITRQGMMLEKFDELKNDRETTTLAFMTKQTPCGNCGHQHRIPNV